MFHPRLCRVVLLAALFCPLGRVAYAANSPQVVDLGAGIPSQILAQCQVGELRPSSVGHLGVLQPGVKVLQLLDPAACTACPSPQSLALLNAVIRLRFLEACTVVLRVSVVEAGGTPACPAPDTLRFICPPALYTIGEPAGAPSKDYLMPFAAPCCLTRMAFLSIEVVSVSCPISRIVWAFAQPCTPCTQYIASPVLSPGIQEQCASGFDVNYRVWVDADCCGPTPAIHNSWSRIKILYR